ncbi:MAG: division/cell wall cluster transcriptional repressor MraZ [Pseudomonadota bacterium]
MFRGATKVTLDAKGRLAVPTRYRERVHARCEGQVVVTVDRQHCLLIYPLRDWEDIERQLIRLPSSNRKVREYKQMMVGYATELELDANGRILLPKELREFADLDRQVVLVGQGNKFELWDEARWNEKRTGWLAEDAGDDEELPPELEAIPW